MGMAAHAEFRKNRPASAADTAQAAIFLIANIS
jgi:hypothetical protein